MRRAAKTDLNQAAIASALMDAYFSVAYTYSIGDGFPDLVIGGSIPCGHCGKKVRQNKLLEVKSAVGTLTPEQKIFHQCWNGQISIVRTVDEALAAVGLKGAE